VARNYTMPTTKTLFGEARVCAYPECHEPLIFNDRGLATVIAEIAYIRSESPVGPRHVADYMGDLNGPGNLILLCGKHHRPVDRHEIAYSIAELEAWKLAQRETAGSGIDLSDQDLRAFTRLGEKEEKVIMDLARQTQHVVGACRSAQQVIESIRAANEREHRQQAYRMGPIYEILDDRTQRLANEGILLSGMEQHVWNGKIAAAHEAASPRVQEALAGVRTSPDVAHRPGSAECRHHATSPTR
jgi:hypothetical protein